jgi:hypothetical protein
LHSNIERLPIVITHKSIQISFGLVLVLLLVGCTSQGMSLTLAANHHIQGTEFYDVQMTASVQAGRLQSTQDYFTTQVALLATQSQFLKGTLVARGTPVDVLNAYQQQIESGGNPLPTRTPRPTPTFAPLLPPTPLSGGPGIATPVPANNNTVPTVDPLLNAAPPTSGPRLVDLATAPGVNDDDCAQNASTTFAASTPEIYIVATAYEVTSGMTLAAQWDVSGQQRTFEFTPDFDIDGACIWFYIDQSEFTFQPGEGRVSLSLNGTPMGSVTFTLQ